MKFKTINPATEEVLKEYETATKEEVDEAIKKAKIAFKQWKTLSIDERVPYFKNLATILRQNKDKYAKLMTEEMGKPISDSKAEVEKCAWTAEVYAENAEKWMEEELVKADGKKNIVTFEPLGVIFSIMPWNFPLWQAYRFAIPSIIAGNVSILKHASVVPGCGIAIEESFKEAGFPDGIFQNLLMDHDQVKDLMESDNIQGVSLTGSVPAGQRVGEQAGKNLKKFVLELGGSDPFIVLEDANIDKAAEHATVGRTINAGQSCIAAKRFIVVESVAEEFSKKFAENMSKLIVGDPMDEKTQIGALANKQQFTEITEQAKDAISKGAKILAGGERHGDKGYFFKPTVMTNTSSAMKIVNQEVFGPIAPIIIVKDEKEAIETANNSEFGLAGSVWTNDLARGEKVARLIESGAVFVNSFSKSDPRMPFGGIKKSGIGRELSHYGLKEFVNVKGISIYEGE